MRLLLFAFFILFKFVIAYPGNSDLTRSTSYENVFTLETRSFKLFSSHMETFKRGNYGLWRVSTTNDGKMVKVTIEVEKESFYGFDISAEVWLVMGDKYLQMDPIGNGEFSVSIASVREEWKRYIQPGVLAHVQVDILKQVFLD